MKISKITKILPLALALSLSIGCANADVVNQDGTTEAARIDYTLTLDDYIQVTESGGATTADGTFGLNYATLDLTTALSANFKVITNSKKRTLTLTSPSTAQGAPSAIYGYANGLEPAEGETANEAFYLVFVHSGETVPAESVTSITGANNPGSANVALSPNAFAFKVNATVTHTNNDSNGVAGKITGTWDTDHIKYVMDNGIATLDLVLEQQAMTDTFNTRDTSGTYTATLILTDMDAGS